MQNYQNVLTKQKEYENLKVNEKLKHENKVLKQFNIFVNHYSNTLNEN